MRSGSTKHQVSGLQCGGLAIAGFLVDPTRAARPFHLGPFDGTKRFRTVLLREEWFVSTPPLDLLLNSDTRRCFGFAGVSHQQSSPLAEYVYWTIKTAC